MYVTKGLLTRMGSSRLLNSTVPTALLGSTAQPGHAPYDSEYVRR